VDPLRRQVTDDQLLKLLKVIETLRILDREMPAQLLSTFLYVASHDGCHKPALSEDLDFSEASSSRCTDWLSRKHRIKGRDGLNLITKEADPANRRRHVLRLTPQGQLLAQQLRDILYE